MDTKRLDKEEEHRIKQVLNKINSGETYTIGEILKYNKIAGLLEKDTVFINYDFQKMLLVLPFHTSIFFSICPCCECVTKPDLIKPFLAAGCFIPVLYQDYINYPPNFISELIKYPHMTLREYDTLKYSHWLQDEAQGICNHCFRKIDKKCNKLIKNTSKPQDIQFSKDIIFANLFPYRYPDINLLQTTLEAIEKKDFLSLEKTVGLSFCVSKIRTAQSLNSVIYLDEDDMLIDSDKLLKIKDFERYIIPSAEREAVLEGIEIVLPKNKNVEKYIEEMLQRKVKIREVVDSIISNVSSGKSFSYSKLLDYIATTNENIRKIEKGTRYKVLKDISIILGSNKSIIAGMLIAATLGVAKSTYGCEAALLSTLAAHIMEKMKLIRIDDIIKEDIDSAIKRTLEPITTKLLSIYLGVAKDTINIWRIRKDIKCIDK